jgi:hypothetical protein
LLSPSSIRAEKARNLKSGARILYVQIDFQAEQIRGLISKIRQSREKFCVRVVEPELDMSRLRPQQSAAVSRIRVLMRWLIPSMGVTTAPMRSIAREIEEAFPSGER